MTIRKDDGSQFLPESCQLCTKKTYVDPKKSLFSNFLVEKYMPIVL